MRRFDEFTGIEMWVSDCETFDGFDWVVCAGFDVFGISDVISSGTKKYKDHAIEIATQIYEDSIEDRTYYLRMERF